MFLRTTQGTNKKYLSIVEGYRENGKVKQRKLLSLGAVDEINKDQLTNLAKKLLDFCNVPLNLDIYNSEELTRKNWGSYLILNKLWDMFKFEDLWKGLLKDRKLKIDVKEVLMLLLSDRLCSPCSKFKSFKRQDYYHGIKKDFSLQDVYRTLDELSDYKEDIEKHIFKQNKNLFNIDAEVIFYDVTTFYFESIKSDDLRDFGYGKDGKFNEVQVVFGMITNEEGRPIGFDIFSGNTYEGNTFKDALIKLKNKYNIKRVTIVADRGLNSGTNLLDLKSCEFEYIVGSRIKNLNSKLKESVLDIDSYTSIKTEDDTEVFKYKVVEYLRKIKVKDEETGAINIVTIESKIICTWSSKRAKKDRKDRERLVEKAGELIKTKKCQNKRGAQKYINNINAEEAELDEEKIEFDSRWDGFYGVETSDQNLSSGQVLDSYKKLWKIEESFKILKSHLEARPVFHWTKTRIIGHFVLSYIAFLFERTLELELKKENIETYSANHIRECLTSMEFSEILIDGKRFYLRSKLNDLSEKILNILKIKIPKNISLPEKF